MDRKSTWLQVTLVGGAMVCVGVLVFVLLVDTIEMVCLAGIEMVIVIVLGTAVSFFRER